MASSWERRCGTPRDRRMRRTHMRAPESGDNCLRGGTAHADNGRSSSPRAQARARARAVGAWLTSWALVRRHHPERPPPCRALAPWRHFCSGDRRGRRKRARRDLATLRSSWPPSHAVASCGWLRGPGALVDIETTGLTPGYGQITVIGLADARRARAFVSGRPQGTDLVSTRMGPRAKPTTWWPGVRSGRHRGDRSDRGRLQGQRLPGQVLLELADLNKHERRTRLRNSRTTGGAGGGSCATTRSRAERRPPSTCGSSGSTATMPPWPCWSPIARPIAPTCAPSPTTSTTASGRAAHLDCAKQVDFTAIKGQQLSLF